MSICLIVLFGMMYFAFDMGLDISSEFLLIFSILIYSLSIISAFLFPFLGKNDPDFLKKLIIVKAGFYTLLVGDEIFLLFILRQSGLDLLLETLWILFFLLFSFSIILDFRYALNHLMEGNLSGQYISNLHIFYGFIAIFSSLVGYYFIWYYRFISINPLDNLGSGLFFLLGLLVIFAIFIGGFDDFCRKILTMDKAYPTLSPLYHSLLSLKKFYIFLCIYFTLDLVLYVALIASLTILGLFIYSLIAILLVKIIIFIWSVKTLRAIKKIIQKIDDLKGIFGIK